MRHLPYSIVRKGSLYQVIYKEIGQLFILAWSLTRERIS